ncbi:uncharacterized protein LOC125177811 [Hyalella azteca]|uniref:Uncharacterized protein LOC125177811 n=1 Tax=Hyalella azteca TaxID=294128 RepID=A0A979FI09_HYAAZ|nr:uncharacterized protein LOC125177811 [Hyalella azteca]
MSHSGNEDNRTEWQCSFGSADTSTPSPSLAPNTLSPNSLLSAHAPHPRVTRPSHSLGLSRMLRRKGSYDPTQRSASDDKSDISEYSWRSDSMLSDLDYEGGSQSVFSLNDATMTPAPSWISSNHSLQRQESYQHRPGSLLQRQDTSVTLKAGDPPSRHSPVQASRSLCVFKHARSNSATEKASGQARLTVPGDSNKSRRPSLLSLRSLTRSPIPYMSMDYDPDYENDCPIGWQYYGRASPHPRGSYSAGMSGLIPEAIPRLTLTQRLAFPNLVQNSLDRPRPRDPFSEENNGMNRAAKLITLLVLTMVTVLIIVGVYKTFH